MTRPSTRLILFWTVTVSGLAAIALLASVRSNWVQDRLFGPEPPSSAREYQPNPDPDLLSDFDRVAASRWKDRCTKDRYLVEFQIDGMISPARGEVQVDGDTVSTATRVGPHWTALEPLPQRLTREELMALWGAVEGTRPPTDQPRKPLVVIDGFAVAYAVCRGGNAWTAVASSGESEAPALRATGLFLRFLTPPYRAATNSASH